MNENAKVKKNLEEIKAEKDQELQKLENISKETLTGVSTLTRVSSSIFGMFSFTSNLKFIKFYNISHKVSWKRNPWVGQNKPLVL